MYEEGDFYYIFYNHPAGPNYLLIGQIDGNKIFCYPEHPAPIYEAISLAGKAWQTAFRPFLVNIETSIFVIRAAFASNMFFIFLLLLVLSLINYLTDRAGIPGLIRAAGVLILLSVTPLAVKISTSLQVDGSIGVLLPGLAAVSFYLYDSGIIRASRASVLVGLAALLLGLGKTEWSMAFLAAIAVTAIILYISGKNQGAWATRDEKALLFLALSGIVIGNIISLLFDRLNYLNCFRVMLDFYTVAKVPFLTHIARQVKNVYLLLTLFLALTLAMILNREKRSASIWLIYIWGSMLFLAYLVNQHEWSDVRYFGPGYITLATGFILVMNKSWIKITIMNLGMAVLAVILLVVYVTTGIPGGKTSLFRAYKHILRQDIQAPLSLPNLDCIPIIGIGETVGFDTDFFTNSTERETAVHIVSKYNKKICSTKKSKAYVKSLYSLGNKTWE